MRTRLKGTMSPIEIKRLKEIAAAMSDEEREIFLQVWKEQEGDKYETM